MSLTGLIPRDEKRFSRTFDVSAREEADTTE